MPRSRNRCAVSAIMPATEPEAVVLPAQVDLGQVALELALGGLAPCEPDQSSGPVLEDENKVAAVLFREHLVPLPRSGGDRRTARRVVGRVPRGDVELGQGRDVRRRRVAEDDRVERFAAFLQLPRIFGGRGPRSCVDTALQVFDAWLEPVPERQWLRRVFLHPHDVDGSAHLAELVRRVEACARQAALRCETAPSFRRREIASPSSSTAPDEASNRPRWIGASCRPGFATPLTFPFSSTTRSSRTSDGFPHRPVIMFALRLGLRSGELVRGDGSPEILPVPHHVFHVTR